LISCPRIATGHPESATIKASAIHNAAAKIAAAEQMAELVGGDLDELGGAVRAGHQEADVLYVLGVHAAVGGDGEVA
jgi:hypothetical protein